MTKKTKKKAAIKKIVAKKVCLALLRETLRNTKDAPVAATFMRKLIGKDGKGPSKLNGRVIGYDPGGNKKHGVAAIQVTSGQVTQWLCHTPSTAQEVLNWIETDKQPVLAIGVDTLTHWNMGRSGDRQADRRLRTRYDDVKKSVIPSNSMYGAMSVNGMAVLMKMREKHRCVPITETHPKVLYHHFTGRPYHYKDKNHFDQGVKDLIRLLELKNDHELDALISAYAALQGLRGCWTEDLAADVHNDTSTVWPCGCVHYWWPEKIT